MRSRISLAAAALAVAVTALPALAVPPSVATLDSHARAFGNRKADAERIGSALFQTRWPAQVLAISADGVGRNVFVGLRISGTKFHGELTRDGFEREVAALARRTFAADRDVVEVDVWAVVPAEGKVRTAYADIGAETERTVFTVTVLRRETEKALARRLHDGRGIYWNEDWARALGKHRV